MPAGTTPVLQHIVALSMPAGMRRVFAELGTPLDTLDVRFVNGQFYSRLRPLISPDRPATKLPPMPLLKLAVRLHPEMRRRNRIAARTLASEPWVQVIHDWHHGGKAAIEAANMAIQSTDLGALTDDEVVSHVRRCIEHCRTNWEHHFWLHGYDIGPIGLYLFDVSPWGIDVPMLLSLLEGASPSTTAPTAELVHVRRLVDADGPPPTTLEELRGRSSEIAALLDAYLMRRGAVLFSRYDVDGVTLGERPDLVLAAVLNAELRDTSAEVARRTAEVRERVPPEHRARFDQLLRQARDAMDLRDDNGPVTAEWPLGLLRLAMLELGRRMVTNGSVDDPALAFELEPAELETAVLGAPDGATLRERAATRAAARRVVAPLTLGPAEPAPPAEVLPTEMARMVGMVQLVMRYMGMSGDETVDGLAGTGIGDRVVTARARVATSSEEALDRMNPGDVLVVAGTTPAYNLVLSLAGAVVTAEGGPMSHAAVIARELGISAVVGARAALTEIADGALVTVDPVAGRVTVVEGA
jgi:pyruvate,water dikinase